MSNGAAAAPASHGTTYVVLISSVAATGGFLFGYDTAVVNGTIGALERHFSADAGRLGFAVVSALSFLLVARWVKETKGRTLEEM